jgi:hypothetical protein
MPADEGHLMDASWGGSAVYENCNFYNFPSTKNWCGGNVRLIALGADRPDNQGITKFTKTLFSDVGQDVLAYLVAPSPGWANLDDCGDFPCTAPNNVVVKFENTLFGGDINPDKMNANFQIISNNPSAVKNYTGCSLVSKWNAFYCQNSNIGVLLMESLDSDGWKRMITPINVTNYDFGSVNTLNTFMDHIWDGFYTGQLRMPRWPSIIQTGVGMNYEIVYSGTPPSNQRFSLRADGPVTIKIDYTKPGVYGIVNADLNKQITANPWSDALRGPSPVTGK